MSDSYSGDSTSGYGGGGMGDMNALGNPKKISVDSYDGGRAGTGPIGNTRPTGIVADGLSIETSPTLFATPSVRKGMSTQKNESLKSMSSRK